MNIPDYRPDARQALPPPHQRKLLPWPATIREAITANKREAVHDQSMSRLARLECLKSLPAAAEEIEQKEANTMSRSGYTEGDAGDELAYGRWRGAVISAIQGRRGQEFLRELLAILDAMPDQQLIANSFATDAGVCALGAVFVDRGVEPPDIDPDDIDLGETADVAADALGITHALAAEIMDKNDCGWNEAPNVRWRRMRGWVKRQLMEKKP